MMVEQSSRDDDIPTPSDGGSAAQLRREAAKARALADAAFGEDERRRLIEVAGTLDREANAIEAALTRKKRKADGPS